MWERQSSGLWEEHLETAGVPPGERRALSSQQWPHTVAMGRSGNKGGLERPQICHPSPWKEASLCWPLCLVPPPSSLNPSPQETPRL